VQSSHVEIEFLHPTEDKTLVPTFQKQVPGRSLTVYASIDPSHAADRGRVHSEVFGGVWDARVAPAAVDGGRPDV